MVSPKERRSVQWLHGFQVISKFYQILKSVLRLKMVVKGSRKSLFSEKFVSIFVAVVVTGGPKKMLIYLNMDHTLPQKHCEKSGVRISLPEKKSQKS